MIKFFRHIRKSLIEKNQMCKYFKYVIGEILLVVIGILIALQISNWNDNRISQNSKTQYCEQSLEEIELGITVINVLLKRHESDINAYNTYEAICETPNLSLDTIYKNIKKLTSSYGLASFNTKTIEVLKSTGDIKLFPNTIQTLLITLQTKQFAHKEYNDTNYSMYLNLVNETYLFNSLSIESKLANQKSFSNALGFMSKLPEQLAKLHLAFSAKNYAERNGKESLNTILTTINKLKPLIEKELKE